MSKARAKLRPIRSPTSLVMAYGPSGIGSESTSIGSRSLFRRPPMTWFELAKTTRSTPAKRRGVKDVCESIEVRADQVFPRGEFIGVGRQMNDRVDAMEVRDPVIVQNFEVGRDDLWIIRIFDPVDQHEVVHVGPGGT